MCLCRDLMFFLESDVMTLVVVLPECLRTLRGILAHVATVKVTAHRGPVSCGNGTGSSATAVRLSHPLLSISLNQASLTGDYGMS